jgi:P-type Cu2+ transporter
MSAAAKSLAPSGGHPSDRAAATAESSCAHCGLPVVEPAASSVPGARFCCAACGVAYEIIHGAGLGAYYERRNDAKPRAARSTGKSYAEYDDPAFATRYVTPATGGARIELFLSGIHCTACVWLVERLPRVLGGVREARFDLGRSALDVVFEPSLTRPSDIARALDGLGYPPHPSSVAQLAGQKERDRAIWLRLGVAGALAGNVMLMALALYSGAEADPAYAALFRWGSFLLTIPSVFFCGSVFLRGGLASLRTRTPHMDLPISIGILAGFARSAWNTVFGVGEVYFDSLAVLIFLLLVGRWLQARHHRGATHTLELIRALAPATARRVDGDETREVPADAVPAGAVIEVLADERIPVDGIVVAGRSCVDTSWLTGESLPESIGPGDRVYAGTVNVNASLRLRVEVAGAETRLGRLLQSVEQAQSRRAPIVRLADRVAGYFVWAALGLSAFTFALWSYLDPSRAIDHAVALLVVTCPCALGMATPLAVSAALKRAARAGIFFKGGEFLEALARPGFIAFDKTGTLTEGRLAVASFVGDAEVLPLVRAAEKRSGHPIGRAIVASLSADSDLEASEVREVPGAGLVARVGTREVKIGSAAFVRDGAPRSGAPWESALAGQTMLGRPAVAVALDGQVKGVLAFSDPLRSDACLSLDRLRGDGYQVAILSGDHPAVVDAIARALSPLVAARGAMRPEDKLAWVERARAEGPVVMVGDGINDAAAMAAADVAIAVHGGAEAAMVAADVFTTQPGVGKVLEAVTGARRTLHVIRRGIAWSLAYNVVGVGLCMAGLISPLMAAILMPLSSLTVVTSALRARTFDAPLRKARR